MAAWLAAWVASCEAASVRLASWEARLNHGTREIEVLDQHFMLRDCCFEDG